MRFRQIPDWSPGYINVCPQHVDIVAKCLACGEQRPFDKQKLPAGKRHALIEDIEPHMKCMSCGAKSGKLLFGSYERE